MKLKSKKIKIKARIIINLIYNYKKIIFLILKASLEKINQIKLNAKCVIIILKNCIQFQAVVTNIVNYVFLIILVIK